MRKYLTKLWNEKGEESVKAVVEVAANKLSAVSISLRDPIVAPKIFERLNNRAELVTVADLVRNEVFARASSDPALAATTFNNHWEPFSALFSATQNGLEKFLFPYGLIVDRQLTKAELFSVLRQRCEVAPVGWTGGA